VHRYLVNDCVDDGNHGENLAHIRLWEVVSVSYRYERDKHTINADLEVVRIWIFQRVKIFQHHKEHRGDYKHDQEFYGDLFDLLIYV
jgi:hypothetical protein